MRGKFTYTSLKTGRDKLIYLGISKDSFLSNHLEEIRIAIDSLSKKTTLKHLNIAPQH